MAKILVLEDDSSIRGAIVTILELEGFHVLIAEDGLAGLRTIRADRPDLVICDIMMPYLDGYGVLHELQQDAATASLPFVFLTARTAHEDIRQGMNLGADDYLTKPFTEEELLNAVRSRLAKQSHLARRLQQRLDELGTRFAGALSHELRTPLHGIMAGASFLKEEYATLDRLEILEFATLILESAERLRRQVENQLLLAELSSLRTRDNPGQPEHGASTSIARLVRKAAEQEVAASLREADLALDLQEVNVLMPARYISKIAEELLHNAFTFSRKNSPIRVITRLERGYLHLTIHDQGRGMSPEQVEAIGAYVQFERHRYEQQGLGLGLAIVKQLVALYEGKISIESMPERGTTVHVMLPSVDE